VSTADAVCASTQRGCRGEHRAGSEAKILGDDSLQDFGGHICPSERKARVMSPESETAGHETCLKEHLLVWWPQTFRMFRHVKDCIKLSEETHGSPGLLEVWEYDTGGI
jgi:hypothetical protein